MELSCQEGASGTEQTIAIMIVAYIYSFPIYIMLGFVVRGLIIYAILKCTNKTVLCVLLLFFSLHVMVMLLIFLDIACVHIAALSLPRITQNFAPSANVQTINFRFAVQGDLPISQNQGLYLLLAQLLLSTFPHCRLI